MQSWDDLQQASLDGVEFEFVKVTDTFGHEYDGRGYVGRDGEELEHRAATARTLQVVAVFADDSYAGADALRAVLLAGGVKKLVHPVHGALQVGFESWTEDHDSDDSQESVQFQIHFKEHTPPPPNVVTDTVPARANAVRSNASDVSLAAAAVAALVEASDTPQLPGLIAAPAAAETSATAAIALSTSLEDDGDIMSSIEIQAATNTVLSQIQATSLAIDDYASEEAFELGQALALMASAVQDLALLFLEAKPPLVETKIKNDVPLLVWVHARYGSSDRADEVLSLNPFLPDPMLLQRGTKVSHYAF